VADVAGAGALFGIFLDGGPRILDLAAKLAPRGLMADPRFRIKLITCSVVDALYRSASTREWAAVEPASARSPVR